NNGSITAIFHHFSSFHFFKKNRFQILEIVKRINSRILKISIGTGFSPFLFLENSFGFSQNLKILYFNGI
ncbi:hypothetical protein, partial [Cloacibacterium normanense]|uniref:hypothetical protein n=1 Tax=Cloacibacterium normanense TaxID=237258 RepID=UPI0035B1A1AF